MELRTATVYMLLFLSLVISVAPMPEENKQYFSKNGNSGIPCACSSSISTISFFTSQPGEWSGIVQAAYIIILTILYSHGYNGKSGRAEGRICGVKTGRKCNANVGCMHGELKSLDRYTRAPEQNSCANLISGDSVSANSTSSAYSGILIFGILRL